jgi:hypothetical protein
LIEEVPDIEPVLIMPVSPASLVGLEVKLVGWGRTMEGYISRYLRTAVLTVLSKTKSENRIRNLVGHQGYLPNNIICSVAEPFILTTGVSFY